VSGFALIALVGWFWPGLREFLLYDRSLIESGEWWRFWSGHLAHHSTAHLFWNVVVFILAGAWVESIRPAVARTYLILAPFVVSGILWHGEPKLEFYAGLSGITVGVVTLLALIQLNWASGEPRWVWVVFLALVAAKVVFEFARPAPALFAGLPAGIRNVPLAHLGGAICAIGVFLATVRKRRG
jgi:rhomboid family GlyGly-CTERM serine protease